jgi:hypothetical protein
MKPFDYYSKPQTIYPNKLNYITYYVYDKGEVLWSGPSWEKDKSELKEKYPNAVIQEVLDEEGYKSHQQQYKEEQKQLNEEFEKDLFEEFGVSDNPKKYKALAYAWDKGHSSGYAEVYNEFSDIVELIKD